MHHGKNLSIKFVAEFVGEEREREPLQPRLCVPQNLVAPNALIISIANTVEVESTDSSCARSYDAPGMIPRGAEEK